MAARWPDLEAVAFLVTLDADVARRATADALAGLHQRWREAVEDGRPGEEARRAVLGAVLDPDRPTSRARTPPGCRIHDGYHGSAVPEAPAVVPWDEPADDPVLTALTTLLRDATPLQRATVAGHVVWAAGPEEVAALAGMPGAAVRAEAETLRARLAEAHDRARDGQGLAPAEWELDRDLDDAVTALLRDQGDPPDPAALVVERARGVRRRAVVVGGLGRRGVAAGAWAVGAGLGWGGAVDPAGSDALPPPGDPSWASTSTWAARGALAADEAIQALVIARSAPGSRLLWADDAGDRRIVVARVPPSTLESTAIAVWVGRRGADPGIPRGGAPDRSGRSAAPRTRSRPSCPTAPARAASSSSSPVPRVLRCAYSPVVEYRPAGGVRRRWTEVELEDGAGASYVPTPPVPRCGCGSAATTGRPPVRSGSASAPATEDGAERDVGDALLVVASAFVAGAAGSPRTSIRSAIVRYGIATGDVIDPHAVVAEPHSGRVAVVHTTTAEGALLRSVRVRDDGRGWAPYLDLETARPISAEDGDRPFAAPLPAVRDDVGRFLVVAPGAAKAQLLAVTPTPTRSRGSATCARASASWRSSTPARPRSTASSCGMPTGRGPGRGGSSSAGGTPTTCGRGSADPRAQRPWLATAAAAAAAASGSRYSPGSVGMKSSPRR